MIGLLLAVALGADGQDGGLRPVTLVGSAAVGVGGLPGFDAPLGGVGGRLTVNALPSWRLDLGYRESFVPGSSPVGARMIGTVIVQGRYVLPGGGFLQAGPVHQHEIGWETVKAEPGASIAGVASEITHRTGFGLAAGVHKRLADQEHLGVFAAISLDLWPDDGGPHGYAVAELGVAIDAGRPRVRVE